MQEEENKKEDFFRGRGSQVNPNNKFNKHTVVTEHIEGLDEPLMQNHKTEIIFTHPKTIINKVDSPDLGMAYSMNPYQGCEHGCIYCYARNTHEYWGYSAGLDFERKIIVKQDVVATLEKHFSSRNWEPHPIMLSGNTDCYQPVERKMKITRGILETCLKYKHPVGLITKNSLITRDLDILSELAKLRLAHVMVSITGLTEETRQLLEPRTVTYKARLNTLKKLSQAGIPCGVMVAPIIPGLNNHEIPGVIEQAAANGATTAGYTIVRLNGAIGGIFKDWLYKSFPDRADKVWNQISSLHGGQVNDSRYGTRMSGEGKIAESIWQLFAIAKRKHMGKMPKFEFDLGLFDYRSGDSQMRLF
jgi:DNA repair photolyase